MAFEPTLDITITEAQAAAILLDLNNARAGVTAIADITISNEEREHLNGIDNERLPYIQRAVEEFGPAHPALESKRVTTVRAGRLFDALIQLRNLNAKLDEYKDQVNDLSNNCEELLYRYTLDMYRNAKAYKNDIPNAEVVAEYLGELFANQGVQNPAEEPVNP